MPNIYQEFDSTPATLLADLRTKVLTSTDWADITPVALLLSTSVAPAAAATTLTFTSTTGFPLAVGRTIAIDTGSAREYRIIATITATTITLTVGLTNAHALGVGIYDGSVLVKATTTRGAQMVVDLNDGPSGVNFLQLAFWRTHDGTNNGGVDKLGPRYVFHRAGGGTTTAVIHVTLSVGKEHFFLAIEGTRSGEVGPYNAVTGGDKTYAFIADLVPYHAGDTVPTVVAAGATAVANCSWTNQAHMVWVGRNQGNNGSWAQARLLTLYQPDVFTNLNTMAYQPEAAGDGKYYVFPYVVVEDGDGLRGRIAKIFYAGVTDGVLAADIFPSVGRRITYAGEPYKLIQANKSEATSTWSIWGPCGAAANGGSTVGNRSVVIAVPVV